MSTNLVRFQDMRQKEEYIYHQRPYVMSGLLVNEDDVFGGSILPLFVKNLLGKHHLKTEGTKQKQNELEAVSPPSIHEIKTGKLDQPLTPTMKSHKKWDEWVRC